MIDHLYKMGMQYSTIYALQSSTPDNLGEDLVESFHQYIQSFQGKNPYKEIDKICKEQEMIQIKAVKN